MGRAGTLYTEATVLGPISTPLVDLCCMSFPLSLSTHFLSLYYPIHCMEEQSTLKSGEVYADLSMRSVQHTSGVSVTPPCTVGPLKMSQHHWEIFVLMIKRGLTDAPTVFNIRKLVVMKRPRGGGGTSRQLQWA